MNTTPEKKEFNKDQKKFEFTVYLNDNIIVQRFFSVIGFNNKSIKIQSSNKRSSLYYWRQNNKQ